MEKNKRMIIGTPDFVKEKMLSLARDFMLDEIVVATFADTAEDRLRSYQLLAKVVRPQKNCDESGVPVSA